ncbi:MAG TPA: hypothetical protein VFX96_12540 [Pyrinomonadaceae bacterium]|nr:hypothetical protein [Pyrinomonadaceae bacterium]
MPRRASRIISNIGQAFAPRARRAALAAAFAALVLAASAVDARAQRRMTKEYPAAPNVRLFLNNRSGSVTVEGWDKNRVKVTASMESGSTRVIPQVSGEGVTIDIERENREDTGDVNFTIQVPPESTVDIQTKMGNITVRNVRGSIVRARVSTEGDIELTGIRAQTVMAENIRGNILFDAELLNGGSYMLKSVEGDIQLRITAEAGFRLTAVAPRTRSIDLGGFAGRGQFEFFNDRRKVVGKVGDGGASLNMTNGRGSIVFMQR